MIEYRINLKNMETDYNDIKEKMNGFYEQREYFTLIIETNEIHNYTLYMVYDFSLFLKSLKEKETQYLKQTTIYVYNKYINSLLYYLFNYLCSPIAPVKIIDIDGTVTMYV